MAGPTPAIRAETASSSENSEQVSGADGRDKHGHDQGVTAGEGKMELRPLHAFALLAAMILSSAAQAQDPVADFYHGKRITLQVGSEAGGGYDVVAHVVAAHLGNHIPGSPQIIVQDVPGGG